MKKRPAMSYRLKLVLVYCVTIVLVAAAIAVILTATLTRQMVSETEASLHLLTEQVLANYVSQTEAITQQLINLTNSTGVAEQMYAMRDVSLDGAGSYQVSQALVYRINQMINAQTGYDAIYVRLDQGASMTNSFATRDFIAAASALLADSRFSGNTYGRAQWTRSEAGAVYLIRDVYNTAPIRHVGKLVARLRQNTPVSLGHYNETLRCAVVFLDNAGTAISLIGETAAGMGAAAEEAARQDAAELTLGQRYYVSIREKSGWTAVGLMPEATLYNVRTSAARTGLLVALLGALAGSLMVFASTHRMTRQMNQLVHSMDEVAKGNMNLRVTVESNDEIGRMAAHYNTMIDRTEQLLARVVREEASKNKAEYEMLEYKYRSLQSQINPHFIYNALETVNALAKIDGNDEICEVVRHISAFFRQNTGNMQKRFITVTREFDSLKQYAYIYCHIHGESLSTPFSCTPDAACALIPTMILQPVLENALVHGVRSGPAEVRVTARDEGERLIVQVRDNGEGMPPERVEQILNGAAGESVENGRASAGIGIRNVRDRLRLIYGGQAELTIESRSGEGTLVTVTLPLVYDEGELGKP